MSTSSTAFTGSSNFSADLQQVITRAVGIATLPVTTLQNTTLNLQSQSAALSALDAKVASLQSATNTIQAALTSPLVSAASSTAGVLNTTLQANAAPGVYSVDVIGVGSYSSALSQAGSTAVADPKTDGISSSLDYTLTIDGVQKSIHATSASLNDLVDALNTQSNGSLQATIVNVGGSSSPDYRVSFRSAKLGAIDISLNDGSNELVASQTTGSLASYKLNGYSTAVTSDTRTVTIAPGLQVQLLSASSGEATDIRSPRTPVAFRPQFRPSRTPTILWSDAVAANHGQNAGALQGDSILSTVSSTLRSLSSYSNGTADSSLAAFGITLDSTGHLTVDSTAFETASTLNYSSLISLLGSSTGGGFLQSATNALNGLEDSTNGSFKIEETQITDRIASIATQISSKQDAITLLQTNLQQQLSAADAAIATLEQQASYLTDMFATQRAFATQGY